MCSSSVRLAVDVFVGAVGQHHRALEVPPARPRRRHLARGGHLLPPPHGPGGPGRLVEVVEANLAAGALDCGRRNRQE